MPTTDSGEVFQQDAATPLAPARGRLTLVFLLVVAVGLVVAQAIGEPEEGSSLSGPAPEVVIIGFDGTEWRLSTHLADDGRPVVLNLWASWCIPCREEMPELSVFADAHPDWLVVGAAVNDVETDARELAAELAPRYLVGMDATGRLRDRYPSVGMPFTVVIDRSGIIRWSKPGGVTAAELAGIVADQETSEKAVSNRKRA